MLSRPSGVLINFSNNRDQRDVLFGSEVIVYVNIKITRRSSFCGTISFDWDLISFAIAGLRYVLKLSEKRTDINKSCVFIGNVLQ